MGRYCLLRLIILFALSQGIASSHAAAAPQGLKLPEDHPLYVLFRQDRPTESGENLEGRMTTVSIIMALLALGVVVPTLVWCKRLSERLTRLGTNISNADARERLTELANESQSLHARVDHLRQNWQADTTRLESAVRQVDSRIAELEKGYGSLGMVSKDLDNLRSFRDHVERIHAGIQKAFNGASHAADSAETLKQA